MGCLARWGRARQQVYGEMVEEEQQLARDPRKRRTQAVQTLAVVAVLGLLLLGSVLASGQREQPLLADGLPTAEAEVLAFDLQRRRTDEVEVRYDAAGTVRTARVPVSGSFREGERVQVAYDPADPSHVRLVERWEPWYDSDDAFLYGFLWAVLALTCVGLGVGAHVELRRQGGQPLSPGG